MKVWSMKDQLKVGLASEQEFLERCHLHLTIEESRLWDFNSRCGKKVELKTDTYPLSKTENFFMERWSVMEKDKPGGPWQSLGHGVDIFVYLFQKDRTYFYFPDMKKLVKRLDKLTKNSKLTTIKNINWTTAGYKVKREDLEDLWEAWIWEE